MKVSVVYSSMESFLIVVAPYPIFSLKGAFIYGVLAYRHKEHNTHFSSSITLPFIQSSHTMAQRKPSNPFMGLEDLY